MTSQQGSDLKSRELCLSLESRNQAETNTARPARSDVVVAIGIYVVGPIEQVLQISLQAPALRNGIKERYIRARVAWQHDGVVHSGKGVSVVNDSDSRRQLGH